MKKAYLMPQNNVVKTRIRASILAGSTGTSVNAGKATETLQMNNTTTGVTQQPTIKNINGKTGLFSE